LEIKIGRNGVWMGDLGKRGGGGFLLGFRWCGGSVRKRMLSFGFLFFRHQTGAKGRAIEVRLSQERYKASRVRQA